MTKSGHFVWRKINCTLSQFCSHIVWVTTYSPFPSRVNEREWLHCDHSLLKPQSKYLITLITFSHSIHTTPASTALTHTTFKNAGPHNHTKNRAAQYIANLLVLRYYWPSAWFSPGIISDTDLAPASWGEVSPESYTCFSYIKKVSNITDFYGIFKKVIVVSHIFFQYCAVLLKSPGCIVLLQTWGHNLYEHIHHILTLWMEFKIAQYYVVSLVHKPLGWF